MLVTGKLCGWYMIESTGRSVLAIRLPVWSSKGTALGFMLSPRESISDALFLIALASENTIDY